MSPRPRLWLAAIVLASACGGGGSAGPDATPIDAPVDAPIDAAFEVPAFRNPVDLGDLALARAAAERLGVGTRKACDQCHALTADRFATWLTETRAADACIGDAHPTTAAAAKAILDCFRAAEGEPYDPHKLGIYTSGASLPWFQAVIHGAYDPAWGPPYADWTSRMVMPRNVPGLLTQGEFDIVAEWFARGLPQLATVLTEIPPTDGCVDDIQPEVGAHVTAMHTQGWRTLNHDDGMPMFGCAGAANTLGCLASFPLSNANAWSNTWTQVEPTTHLRILYQYNYNSSFWTRSSADGRFVAHGGGPSGQASVIDLMQQRRIPAAALYDPGFFPDNSGFVIQGGPRPWCRMSLLTSSPAQITFNEPECSAVPAVGLYQHVGAVRGGDYWAVDGQFVSDNATGEPGATFGNTSTADMTPMVWNGTSYTAKPQVSVPTPNEGDTEISPSAKLMVSRASNAMGQNGFTLRKVIATPSGGSYSITAPVIGRYCVRGGKPAFSYDERWMVYHHWVEANDWQAMGFASATDPTFVALRNAGTANIFLLDLTTGLRRRITSMQAGQRALFPHFRSDGWIYFVVKKAPAAGSEVVVASDAALVFEN